MTIILALVTFYVILKLAGCFFKIFGKLIGFTFGLIGYILMGVLAITVFGLATFVAPIIILVGIISLIALIINKSKNVL